MNPQVLREYLVSLGWAVDTPSLRRFEDALRVSSQQAEKFTSGIVKDFTIAGTAIVGALTGVATGVAGLIDHVISSDLEMQLFARRMFMGADAAREMKIASDALGVSLQDIIWGPRELQERYRALVKEQKDIEQGFGGNVEGRMRQLRDLRFEFTRLEVAATELSRGFAVSLFDKLFGSGAAQRKLTDFVNWVITSVPRMADELASSLAPTLKNIWQIWSDLADIAKITTGEVLKFIGAIYGDRKLEQGAVSVRNIGAALEHVSATVKTIVGYLDRLVNLMNRYPILAKTLGGAAAEAVAGSILPGVGTGAGAAIGGAVGLTAGVGTALGAFDNKNDITAQARKAASQISQDTGIPASILFGQFAHETGGFTNRGATQLNNLAGIEQPSGGAYRNFGSFDEFTQFYERLIESPRYRAALTAKTPEDFAKGLKAGGYYEDSYSNYVQGIKHYAPEYRPGNESKTYIPEYKPTSYPTQDNPNIDVGGITVTVHVTEPGASAEHIAQAVKTAMSDQVRRNLIPLSGVFA